MNARQKAKHYKKLYLQTLSSYVTPNIIVEHKHIQTVRCEKIYSAALIEIDDGNVAIQSCMESLAESLRPYTNIVMKRISDDVYKVITEVEVVER